MKKIILFIYIVFAFLPIVSATTFRVNNNNGINNNTQTATFYNNYDAAQTAASNGDTIIIEPSPTIYPGITVSKSLTIVGTGYYWQSNSTSLISNRSYIGSIQIAANHVYLYGLSCSTIGIGNNSTGGNNILINRCYIEGSISYGDYNLNTSNILIKECYITSSINFYNAAAQVGLQISNNIMPTGDINVNSTDIVVIENNTMNTYYPSGGSGNIGLNGANAVVRNNILGAVTNYSNATVQNNISLNSSATALPSGNGNVYNITKESLFVGPNNHYTYLPDTYYKLKANSPALNAGFYGNGDDIGAYNDGTNRGSYRDNGVPPFPTISQFSTGAINGNTMNATISTKANN